MMNGLALVAASIERFAVEIRNLQRTDVLEVEEYFSKGQKGSSAMPHKRNPIRSERLTGMARLVRGYAVAALENVALWHERDISHSSVERVAFPDAFILTHFMLSEITDLVKHMLIHTDNMTRNMWGGV
jgi:adenylosuccinate lyase